MTFKQFLDSTKAYPSLSQEEIAALMESPSGTQQIIGYAYRLAGEIGAEWHRLLSPMSLDDDMFMDAIQDCIVVFPRMLTAYAAVQDKYHFEPYIRKAFKYHAYRALLLAQKGGITGTREELAKITMETATPDDNTDLADEIVSQAFHTRDPFEEVAAEQMASRAISYRQRNPKPGNPWV